MKFHEILEKYRKYSFSERDKGDRFERLMQAYLNTDPQYADRFKHVWMWNEFPARKDFGGKDTGIDLVALTHEGDYWAIQCKCYQEDTQIDKPEVDSFLSTSGKQFTNENYQTVGFTHRLWISTTNKWGTNAEQTIRNQQPPVSRINLFNLEEAPIDWGKLEKGVTGDLARTTKKTLYKHQVKAVSDAHEHYQNSDRGKMIMACGTGKTFTSLRIAENESNNGLVLFLVPSIALLGQTLREWMADSIEPINPICICSDPKISKKHVQNDFNTMSVVDLALPASTDVPTIVRQFQSIKALKKPGMTVVFSTYQSIDVVTEAQKAIMSKFRSEGYGIFDMVICDEAHRTTGVALNEEDSSAFIKIHKNENIEANKRLYMTATPRLYSDDSKAKAAQEDAILCSMDDQNIYGDEFYRIGFGEAVDKNLLSDYKVLILTINDNDVPANIQSIITNDESEINTDDASKLIGCINALSKQVLGDEGIIESTDPEPMKKAVAFTQTIKVSKKITSAFNTASDIYRDSLTKELRQKMIPVESKHIDGTMSAPQRDELMGWLKSTSGSSNECRIITNVRCLSEGVDVPSLDAVMFLSPRNSQVDVVQSVGRVMRKSPGKKYGYIIIPVVVPADIPANEALNDNKRFKVVWSVLNALRAHDDRFNATVNKIDLNKKKPSQILIGRPSNSAGKGLGDLTNELNNQLSLQFEQLQSTLFARMVKKVGDKRYWEQWAKDVSLIAQKHEARIKRLIKEHKKYEEAFDHFLNGLQKNINPNISKQEAIEMLSQHLITAPVFDALFEGFSFVKNNPISIAMQKMLDLLEEQALEKDTEVLNKFYESVRKRAEGIDNSEGKQKIVLELYEKYFKTALPTMVEKLGIVYTPVEVVDFIIHSVNDVLKQEFGRTLSDENIHILDPFTGTGTFITRLLQSGFIEKNDLERKYSNEIHANEIVLLAYYIAAVNIENAFHDLTEEKENYKTFEGICLTDTFQLGEYKDGEKLFSEMFPQNSERVVKQKATPLKVIIGNPPYSVGQKSANDNAQNQKYHTLDSRIEETYAKESKATSIKALYDAYIKAFRWSSDRINPEHGGIIAFVSNGAWIDANGMDGFRKTLSKDFSNIWIYNLRGNQRTSGELSRKEGGKIFGSGSRTPIAISILVKKPNTNNREAKIFYNDIGDYLDRNEKLKIIKKSRSVLDDNFKYTILQPNIHGDWINKRNDYFDELIPVNAEVKFNPKSTSFFVTYSLGLATGRDTWVTNFSMYGLKQNVMQTIDFFNMQSNEYKAQKSNNHNIDIKNFIDTDPRKISWNRNFINDIERHKQYRFIENNVVIGHYRPFCRLNLYFDKSLNAMLYQNKKLFPTRNSYNLIICVSGRGAQKPFSAFISNNIADLQIVDKGQCFPLYYYEEHQKDTPTLFDEVSKGDYNRKDGISDFILNRAKEQYGKNVTKEDIFYYVYGILHSIDYRETFKNDLKKSLPRLPLIDEPRDFWRFSKAGRKLADLHIDYESVEPYSDVEIVGAENAYFKVEKMKFPKKGQKDTIIFNSRITISNIPQKAYEYVVNGKSAIEWIMERYQIKVDKASGIKNDPNDWADETGNPRYILDLLLSIINVSVQTVDIVNSLPELNFEK